MLFAFSRQREVKCSRTALPWRRRGGEAPTPRKRRRRTTARRGAHNSRPREPGSQRGLIHGSGPSFSGSCEGKLVPAELYSSRNWGIGSLDRLSGPRLKERRAHSGGTLRGRIARGGGVPSSSALMQAAPSGACYNRLPSRRRPGVPGRPVTTPIGSDAEHRRRLATTADGPR